MLRFIRLCGCLAAGAALLCASCTGGSPPDGPASSTSPAGSTSARPSLSAKEQALLDKVRVEDRLSVIVTLKLPRIPTGDTEREKTAIADVQDQLLAQLEPRGVQVQTRFELYPLLTLTVDEAVLRFLLVSPLVGRVNENESHALPS